MPAPKEMVAQAALLLLCGFPFVLYYTWYGEVSWWLFMFYTIACGIAHYATIQTQRADLTEEQINHEIEAWLQTAVQCIATVAVIFSVWLVGMWWASLFMSNVPEPVETATPTPTISVRTIQYAPPGPTQFTPNIIQQMEAATGPVQEAEQRIWWKPTNFAIPAYVDELMRPKSTASTPARTSTFLNRAESILSKKRKEETEGHHFESVTPTRLLRMLDNSEEPEPKTVHPEAMKRAKSSSAVPFGSTRTVYVGDYETTLRQETSSAGAQRASRQQNQMGLQWCGYCMQRHAGAVMHEARKQDKKFPASKLWKQEEKKHSAFWWW